MIPCEDSNWIIKSIEIWFWEKTPTWAQILWNFTHSTTLTSLTYPQKIQNKRSKIDHKISKFWCQKRVFSKSGISMDFEIKHGFVQGITLDTFHHVPATFLSRKTQSIRLQTRNHEFMQRAKLRREREGEEEELGEQEVQPQSTQSKHKIEHKIISKPWGPHLYKIQKVYVFILHKLEAKREGKGEKQRGSKAPTKIYSLMTLA